MLTKLPSTGKNGKKTAFSIDGKLLRRTWARGLYTDYQYDILGQLTQIDYSDDTPDITFTYNRLGRPSSVQDAAGTRTFAYNETFDLTSEAISGIYNKTLTRTYTANGTKGRVLDMSIGGENNYTYSYDQYGQLNQITTPAGNFNYNRLVNSNLISQMTRPNNITTTWNHEVNRDLLTQVANGTVSIFVYSNDVLGRRTTMSRSGSAFTQSDVLSYTYNDRSEVTGASSNVDQAYNYTYNFDPIVQCRDVATEQTYFYQTDANKNITELTDNAGAVMAHYEYDPFGNQTKIAGVYAETNPFRFSSEYHDPETQLVYYNYRYYSPDQGRWLSRDPIGEQGGNNLLLFTSNNPIKYYDIWGLYWIFIDWAKITICYQDPITCKTICEDIWFADGDKFKEFLEKAEAEGYKISEISIKGHGSPDGQSLGSGTNLVSNSVSVSVTTKDGNVHDITSTRRVQVFLIKFE
jgi:RHS repeat-associated protein